MKVKVKDLEPNPFRNMPEYPIDETKVQTLMKSIKSTTFWDNILARKHNSKIEIAYGHHRWIALKRLKIKEVDIPIRELSDEDMLVIMAAENMEDFAVSPLVMNLTVGRARKFLTDNPLREQELCSRASAKFKRNIEAKTIQFLLRENYSEDKIAMALQHLEMISKKEISKPAIETFASQVKAHDFATSIKKFKKVTGETPKATAQRKVAKRFEVGKIKKAEIYGDLITEQYPGAGKRTVPKVDFGNYISETALAISNLTRKLTNIRQVMKKYPKEQMPEEMNGLLGSVNMLVMELREFASELKRRKTKQKLLT